MRKALRLAFVVVTAFGLTGWVLAGGRKSRIQELEDRVEQLEGYQLWQEYVVENWAETVEERFELLGLGRDE